MKRLTLLSVSIALLTNLMYSQSVEIRDSGDQLLLQVNDEGANKSSITIPSSETAPTSTTSKLYNEDGTLKWDGGALGTGGSSLWSENGIDIYYNAGKVGIGTDSPSATLQVEGSTKIGTNINVLAITDIIEITGTLAIGSYVDLSYPSGFDNSNTRVMSFEMGGDEVGWFSIGYINTALYQAVYLHPSSIRLIYADNSNYHNKPLRVVLRKVL